MIAASGTAVLVSCAILAAWLDVSSRRLPNWLSAFTLVSGLCWTFAEKGSGALAWAGAHALIALLIGMALFRLGWIGGGDAKFYAACATWFPLPLAFTMLFLVSASGLILVIGWFGYRRTAHFRHDAVATRFAEVPYGLAIGLGAVSARLFIS